MNSTKFVYSVIAVLVAVIFIGSCLAPTVENAINGTKEVIVEETLTNVGTPLIKGDVSSEYDVKWDSNLPAVIKVNGDVTTVYFNKIYESATVSPSSKEVTVDLTYGELPTPTCDGYTFDGWFTSTDYTTEVTETTVVVGTEDKILYAKWVANEYTVTFDADGGTVSPATKTVTFGQEYGELPTPTYTGHIFGGWFDSSDNPITSDVVVRTAENHTLTAVWTLENYLISFTVNDNTMGTVNPTEIYADYGDSFTVSGNTVVFGETTVTASALGSNVFDSWNYSSGTVTGAMTFVATFNNPPVTLYFTTDGTTGATVSTASYSDVPRGTEYVVADNTVTVTGFGTVTASLVNGYYFTGWSVQQGIGTVSAETTFEAQYELIQIAQVSASTLTTWIVTTDGKLFGCGDNQYGQQGNGLSGSGEKVSTFTQRLSNETIDSVICTDITTWALTTDGKVFGCGRNSSGQQGSGTSGNGTDVTTFTDRTPSGETVTQVACYHSLYNDNNNTWLLTQSGKVYGCGANNNGQQGNGSVTGNVTTFTDRTPSGETVTQVATGNNATWLVTQSGKVYGCGANTNGQQGDGTTTNVTMFTDRTPSGETVTQVACSNKTTWLLTQSGMVYGCGDGGNGQQGDGSTSSHDVKSFTDRTPMNGSTPEVVTQVVCSSSTTWLITQSGKIFGCGQGYEGEQGNGSTSSVGTFTDRTPNNKTVIKVNASSEATWFITTDGGLYGTGYGNKGQQGNSGTGNVNVFTQRISGETIGSVVCQKSVTWALTTDGKLFGCGLGDNGQQGDGDDTTHNVTTFTQRTVAGSINIQPVQSPLSLSPLNPIQLSPLHPFTPILTPMSVTPSDVTTVNDWMLGGEQWMIVTVSLTDGDGIALYYAGLTEPLVFDETTEFDFNNGTCTFSHNGTGYTFTYTSIYYQGSGDYILLDDQAYVKTTGSDKSTKLSYYETGDSGAMVDTDGTVSVLADGSVEVWDNPTMQGENSQYDGVFILTGTQINADGDTVDDLAVIVPSAITIEITEEVPAIDPTLAALLVFVVTISIVAVVLAAVRMIGGRE